MYIIYPERERETERNIQTNTLRERERAFKREWETDRDRERKRQGGRRRQTDKRGDREQRHALKCDLLENPYLTREMRLSKLRLFVLVFSFPGIGSMCIRLHHEV